MVFIFQVDNLYIGENCKREEREKNWVYILWMLEKDFKVWIILVIFMVLLQLVYI